MTEEEFQKAVLRKELKGLVVALVALAFAIWLVTL